MCMCISQMPKFSVRVSLGRVGFVMDERNNKQPQIWLVFLTANLASRVESVAKIYDSTAAKNLHLPSVLCIRGDCSCVCAVEFGKWLKMCFCLCNVVYVVLDVCMCFRKSDQ